MVFEAVRSVLLVQPSINPPGGGNAVAAWMLQALQPNHRLTLLSWDPPDFELVNTTFGTTLDASAISCVSLPESLTRAIDLLPMSVSLFKSACLCRRAQRMAPDFDVVVGASNEINVGRPCIQYVHYPRFRFPRPSVDRRWYNASQWSRRAYYEACQSLGGLRHVRLGENLTLANSNYIARLIREHYAAHGVELSPIVLHPPTAGDFRCVSWNERADRVLMIGRISREKRLVDAIEIVWRLRQRGCKLSLDIVGINDDDEYYRRIAAQSRCHDWLRLHENLTREELTRLASSSRYGLHCMRGEHFGMAVAEMQRAGCLVFAPRDGGCKEILGDSELLFDGVEDAVERMIQVIDQSAIRSRLQRSQHAKSLELTSEAFCHRFRELLDRFLAQRAEQAPGTHAPSAD